MAPRKFRISGLVASVLLGVILLASGHAFAQEETDEVIIEGQDRQPAKSSFDYGDTTGDTVDYSSIGTKDTPRPEGASPFREPQLDRDTGSFKHGDLPSSNRTAVDEFSNLELILIGTGVVAVLLVI